MKLPLIKDVRRLLIDLKDDICMDERHSPGELEVTIGADDNGNWGWQTGDNSFSGGAYCYPHWGVVTLTRRSNCTELARDVVDQIADAISSSLV